MKAVVVLPTYNEKENIAKLIPFLEEEVLPKVKNYEMAILVADDNSPDKTAEEAEVLARKYKNIEVSSGPKKGLGAAYIRGMDYALKKMHADVLFEMDADGQHDATKIPSFLKKIDEGYDMVLGTRYSGGGSIPENWPPQRKAFSVVANLFVRTVFTEFNIHDWTGGYRALKKEVFLKEKNELSGYSGYIFQIAFLHKAVRDGFKIGEVPFHFSDRTLGSSKIAPLGYIMDVVIFVLTTRFKELAFGSFGKFIVVGGVGFIINLVIYTLLATHSTMPLWVANTIGAELAIISNFNFNNFWTFKQNRAKSVAEYIKKIFSFLISSNIGVFIFQNGLILLGEKLYGRSHHLIYFLVGTALLLIWNFTIYNKFIWKKKS